MKGLEPGSEPRGVSAASGIKRDEWLAALAEASVTVADTDPNVLTVAELSAVFGVERAATAERVARLIAAGKAERTTKRIVVQGQLTPRVVTAYRLLR